MAETNGISKPEDSTLGSTSHLGKRKRTPSPEVATSPSAVETSPLQAALENVLQLLRKHDTKPSLLNYPLQSSETEAPDLKRARLTKIESSSDTIEERIIAGSYKSFDALRQDVAAVKTAISNDLSTSDVKGEEVQEQLSKLVDLLSVYESKTSKAPNAATIKTEGEDVTKSIPLTESPRHLISLVPCQANGRTQILYSGLETRRPEEDGVVSEEFYRWDPPEGFKRQFQITDFTTLGGDAPKQKLPKRQFGSVFQPANRLNPLKPPQLSKNIAVGSTLDFVPYPDPTRNDITAKNYKFTQQVTGAWISYGQASEQMDQESKRLQTTASAADHKAAFAANGSRKGAEVTGEALFHSVYSSFAPSIDNTSMFRTPSDVQKRTPLIAAQERSRYWWYKYGDERLTSIFSAEQSEDTQSDMKEQESKDNEFADTVANFEPIPEEDFGPTKEDKDVDDVLEEVSALIETLSSYQRNRSLASNISKPPNAEFDIYEMLRNQLSILVSSLPPFAVAKLDGDQLEDLNISTRILVEAPDYPGTGQVDDYTWRQQISRQTAAAASRPAITPQIRPAYAQAQPSYNTQARSYNASVPATAAYGVRAQNYQTPTVPRPVYSGTPYQASATTYPSRPTIQQFQRPLQNGYGSHGASTAHAQTPGFARQPSQPNYQQKAQDNNLVGRSASPQKPMVNGQNYPPRQYSGQQAQTPYPLHRQSSGTPGTPNPAASTAAAFPRYSATPDRASTEAGGRPSTPSAAAAAAAISQTVEVSR
ncbi:hypothetical protein EDD37DRAFT_307469 [Exophiala viscosa]|uniref:uncharacterized protein n=1 Tax=Exophiala viscosa TaxID=2486360 RepID=UPI00218F0FB0|nr:hypothetical protein EDD37DRAFT_307469 [Exophiala viscosa]